jgi:response regulator NasT
MKLRVLLVDDNKDRSRILEQALLEADYDVVTRVDQNINLTLEVSRVLPDVVIIDMCSPDRDTLDSMQLISDEYPRPIVMFTDDEDREVMQSAMKAGVSAYIVDGLSSTRVKPIVDVAIARFHEFQSLRDELKRTQTILEDRKIIDKAKSVIMSQRQVNEEEAYKVLRTTAMSNNKRIVEVAQEIIAVAEMLNI